VATPWTTTERLCQYERGDKNDTSRTVLPAGHALPRPAQPASGGLIVGAEPALILQWKDEEVYSASSRFTPGQPYLTSPLPL
jgi:hypothetical protein